MPVELTLLVWSPVLVGLHIGVQAILYRLEYGFRFAASGRDNEPPPAGRYLQRSEKALRNLLETYAVFVALAVATAVIPRSNVLTEWGGLIWFGARLVYLPLYIFGVPYVRSAVWLVAALGLGLMFLGVVI